MNQNYGEICSLIGENLHHQDLRFDIGTKLEIEQGCSVKQMDTKKMNNKLLLTLNTPKFQ